VKQMTQALEAARRYLADLERGVVAPKEKPTAFQHGLFSSLVAELKSYRKALKDVREVLNEQLGDTDPVFDDDATDEEIKDADPMFWAHRRIANVLSSNEIVSEPTPAEQRAMGSEPFSPSDLPSSDERSNG
jgi:hypothetical protein